MCLAVIGVPLIATLLAKLVLTPAQCVEQCLLVAASLTGSKQRALAALVQRRTSVLPALCRTNTAISPSLEGAA